MNKIGICIPLYLRGKPTNEHYAKVIRYYSSYDITLHLCGSEGELSRKFCEPFINDRVKYFEIPQKAFCNLSKGDSNLRKKFNDSLQTFKGMDLDWYCLAGADDVVCTRVMNGLLTETIYKNDRKPIMAGVENKTHSLIIVPDNEKPYTVGLSYGVVLLPGLNCFNLPAMEVSDWKPYNGHGCETGAERYFFSCGSIVSYFGNVVMFKGDEVLNSNEKIKRSHEIGELSERHKTVLENINARINK